MRGTFFKKKKNKTCREVLGAMENADIFPDSEHKRFHGIFLILGEAECHCPS